MTRWCLKIRITLGLFFDKFHCCQCCENCTRVVFISWEEKGYLQSPYIYMISNACLFPAQAFDPQRALGWGCAPHKSCSHGTRHTLPTISLLCDFHPKTLRHSLHEAPNTLTIWWSFHYLLVIAHRDWNVFSWYKAFYWKFREWSVSVLQRLKRKHLWKRRKQVPRSIYSLSLGQFLGTLCQWGHAFRPSCGSFVSASFLNYTSHRSSGQLFNKCLFLSKRKPKKNFYKSVQAWGKGSLGRDLAWSLKLDPQYHLNCPGIMIHVFDPPSNPIGR